MTEALRQLLRDESGQDLVEYALLVVLIALFCIIAIRGLADAIATVFNNASANLNAAT